MNDKPPSIQEWRDLYDAAIEFKKIGCWNWMWDSDVFGVRNPVSGEIGYCCVMGRAGEHFALVVFLGTEGLEGYLRISTGDVSPGGIDAMLLHRCLMASFEDRKLLQKQDFQVIRALGLKFRGRNAWPLFRSYRPGYHPWYLTSEEAKYLTVALHQAIDVSLRFKNDPEMLTPPMKNQYLVRVPKKERGGLRWRDEWLEPLPLEKVEIIAEPIDASRLEGIKRMVPRRQGVWEIDFFYSPQAVKEKEERLYYPYVILWVDHYSGLILNFHLAKPTECASELPEQFMKLAENIKSLPQEILVKKEEIFKLLELITSRLGIKLRNVKRLITLEEAQADMFGFLSGEKYDVRYSRPHVGIKEEKMELIEEMKKHLPIPVYPSQELCRVLHKQGKDISTDTELKITEAFDSGDAGGIVCSIIEEDAQVFVVSLTHLRVKPDHPLSDEILAYQRQRIKSISRSRV